MKICENQNKQNLNVRKKLLDMLIKNTVFKYVSIIMNNKR